MTRTNAPVQNARRSMRAGLVLLAAAVLAAGCATPPPPNPGRTTVILLPDQEGHVGGVSVTSSAGTRDLEQAYSAVTVAGSHQITMAGTPPEREPVMAQYQRLLDSHPSKPRSLVLYFVLDTTTLTDRSKALLPDVFKAARERKPTEITVYGHADAIGSDKRNLVLSEQRARAIAELLKKSDPSLTDIRVQFFGDKVPLFRTAGNLPEPRNRRVEVEIL